MTKNTYRIGPLFLCLSLLLLFFLAHDLRSAELYSAELQSGAPTTAEKIQTATWHYSNKWRVFISFHALCLAFIGVGAGIVGSLLLSRIGSWLLLIGGVSGLVYLSCEPRSSGAEAILNLELALLFSISVVAPSLLARSKALKTYMSTPLGWLLGLVPATSLLLVFQLLGRLGLTTPVAVSTRQELLLAFYFVFTALPAAVAIWGEAKNLFDEQSKTHKQNTRTRKNVFQALLLVFFLGTIASFLLVQGYPASLREWVFIAPLVPPLMSVYAPLTWFSAADPPAVFNPHDGANNVQQMRFFVGIIFEYLTLITAVTVYQALKYPQSTTRLVSALICSTLYWLPSLWLLWAIGRTPELIGLAK